jgi:hypothetical protein
LYGDIENLELYVCDLIFRTTQVLNV